MREQCMAHPQDTDSRLGLPVAELISYVEACSQALQPSTLQRVGILDLGVRSAVVHLSYEAGGADRPLAELCLRALGGRVELTEQSLSWELGAQLALNIISALHAGWEPVLEPWRCQIAGACPAAW